MSIPSLGKRGVALLLAGAAAPAAGALAAAPVLGPYVSLGAGVDFLQDQSFSPHDGYGPLARQYTFDPGVATQASIGFGLGNGLRLEIEGDYADDHVRGVHLSIPERAGGYEQQFGGFANVLYDLPLRLPVTPFIGLGVGYQDIELDHVNSSRYGVRGGSGVTVDEGDFAYQGIAGLSYPIGLLRGLSLTAEYRFIGVVSPSAFYRGVGPNDVVISNGRRLIYSSDVNNIFNHEVMLGVRYAFNTAPPPPPPAAPVVPAAPPAEARTYLVFFDWDRSDLTPRAREIVAQAAQASTHVQTTRIEVDGYTDNSSIHGGARGARYNIGLSIRRAQSVKAELIRDGVPGSAIDTHGFGESHPLVPTGPDTREPQNRRVEIVLH